MCEYDECLRCSNYIDELLNKIHELECDKIELERIVDALNDNWSIEL